MYSSAYEIFFFFNFLAWKVKWTVCFFCSVCASLMDGLWPPCPQHRTISDCWRAMRAPTREEWEPIVQPLRQPSFGLCKELFDIFTFSSLFISSILSFLSAFKVGHFKDSYTSKEAVCYSHVFFNLLISIYEIVQTFN